MKAEDFIQLIEQGRRDKISPNALDLISKRFRELEKELEYLKSENQALKAKHKEDVIKAYNISRNDLVDPNPSKVFLTGKQYYKQTHEREKKT